MRILQALLALLAATALWSCRRQDTPHSNPGMASDYTAGALALATNAKPEPEDDAARVLVVVNKNSYEGKTIADYYVSRRNIPAANVVEVSCTLGDEISQDLFESQLEDPVRRAINSSKTAIDFIVTTHGIPLRFNASMGYSVDAGLMAMESHIQPIVHLDEASIRSVQSPYFGSNEHFTHARFGLYLVTRLDGYTVDDMKALVDHSLAAKATKGPFYLQPSSIRTKESFGELQATMISAQSYLKRHGFAATLGPLDSFEAPPDPLMGYVSWGSNDERFKQSTQDKVRFLPGAICETYVSTSGRTFGRNSPGQSKIADLIAQGVTGVKGYVSEPYTFALCKADLLLARYTSGYNLAESFYIASPTVKWKDIVIGDPLCNPYSSK